MDIVRKILSGLLFALTLTGPVAVISIAIIAINEQAFAHAQAGAAAKFKIGDRVLASPGFLADDKYFQPCTVTGLAANGYEVRCDPWHGSDTWIDYFVGTDYVRAWPNATAAPKSPECLFDAQTVTVSRAASASETLFKNVINEWFAQFVNGGLTSPLKVNVTFLEFQMGKSYVNRITNNSVTGAHRLNDGAPTDAIIYPVKTTYVHCRAYRDSIGREVVQQNFECFKDKFGDWVCPTDSSGKVLERTSTPVEK